MTAAETTTAVTWFDGDKADGICDLVSIMPATSTGKPMELIPWERDSLREFYGTLTENEDGEAVRQYQYLYFELTKSRARRNWPRHWASSI